MPSPNFWDADDWEFLLVKHFCYAEQFNRTEILYCILGLENIEQYLNSHNSLREKLF